MKKITIVILAIMLASIPTAIAGKNPDEWNTITEGEVLYRAGHYLEGEVIPMGFDAFGYNYHGHLFEGSYYDAYSGGAGYAPYSGDDVAYLAANPGADSHWAWPYRTDRLVMVWNDAWISNIDRDNDGLLDRHYGYSSYIGSGAWETNTQSGTYMVGEDEHSWNYFCKIVAIPCESTLVDDNWITSEGVDIGYNIWGQFAVNHEVYNDAYYGDHGVYYSAPASTNWGDLI